MPHKSLDDQAALEFARADPVGFIRGFDRAVIDEIQRAPELLLAIKRSVDTDKRPGRFLLTGSANLMTLPQVADSLAGRMEITDLLPLSQSELRSQPYNFFERVLQGKPPAIGELVLGPQLVECVICGGYPEALQRKAWERRQKWLLDYTKAVIERDVKEIAKIDHIAEMPRLLRLLSHHAAQLISYSSLGAPLGIAHST